MTHTSSIALHQKKPLLLAIYTALALGAASAVQPSQAQTFVDSGQALGSITSNHGLSMGDVDDDGDLDAFVGNFGPNAIWLNDGNAVFSLGQTFGTQNSQGAALADFDGDGDLDAITANDLSSDWVWLNDGSGFFSDSGQRLSDHFDTSRDPGIGDLDGDGDLDVYMARAQRGTRDNLVYFNDGSGLLSDSGQSLGFDYTHGVAMGDIDGDGDLDAVTANSHIANWNRVWLNDGSGGYSDSGQQLGNAYSIGAQLADLDGDGDLDVFFANGNHNQIPGSENTVWFNDGSGVFTDSGQRLGDSYSWRALLRDLDLDGDVDAFVANRSGQANRVWLNDGDGNFSDTGQLLGSSESVGLGLEDLDGDGDFDAFVANAAGQPNRVWLNQLPLYRCKGFKPPFQRKRTMKLGSHAVLPLGAKLKDGDGRWVRGSQLDEPPRIQVLYLRKNALPIDVTEQASTHWPHDDDRSFAYFGGKWRYHLTVKNFTEPGKYLVKMVGPGEYGVAKTCTTKFKLKARRK